MTVLLMLVILFILFIINVPVAFAIGLSTVVVSVFSDIQLIRLPQSMFDSLNSFPLLAVPFFILAGQLMQYGGISEILVNLANSIVGHLKGGLAHVSIVTCMIFAAISGSAIATTVAIGSIMIPAMVKMGYDRNFSSAVQAAGGITGVIIPPSIPMVLYGVAAGVSVGQLFIAGIVPGILVGISLMAVSYFISRKNNYPTAERKSLKEILHSLKDAIWALLMPVIILGGIYGGWFTPTEAAVVAVVYGFIVGIFVYKKITFPVFKDILRSTVRTTSAVGLIIATASFFGVWLTLERLPHTIAETFNNANLSILVTIIIINIFLIILGTFMDASAALIISTPILVPVVTAMGMDPVHFGIIMILNLGIGLLTPPLGVGLFIAAKVGNTKFEAILKPVIPFIIILIVDVAIVTLFPQISSGVAQFLNN